LWIDPFFVGRGGRADLLYRATTPATFELAGTTTLKSGIVILRHPYRGAPAGEDTEAASWMPGRIDCDFGAPRHTATRLRWRIRRAPGDLVHRC
jgi:hypothetical protein